MNTSIYSRQPRNMQRIAFCNLANKRYTHTRKNIHTHTHTARGRTCQIMCLRILSHNVWLFFFPLLLLACESLTSAVSDVIFMSHFCQFPRFLIICCFNYRWRYIERLVHGKLKSSQVSWIKQMCYLSCLKRKCGLKMAWIWLQVFASIFCICESVEKWAPVPASIVMCAISSGTVLRAHKTFS